MTAWGAFVGLFLARISRGRTIRQVALFSFIAPLVYAFIWFCTFGGIGLRQARTAEELEFFGAEIFGDPAYFRVNGSEVCYNVPQEDIVNQTSGEVVWSNTVPGVTPVCQKAASATDDWFNVMFSFSFKVQEDFAGFGGFMAGLSLIGLTIYFVTSSDSGSLIVDHLASNGHEDHHWLQRVFWAFTEGAVATALLMAGGGSALNALQAASIVLALPFVSKGGVESIIKYIRLVWIIFLTRLLLVSFIGPQNLMLFAMMYCTVRMCNVYEKQSLAGEHNGKLPAPENTSFKMPVFGGIFNIVEWIASIGKVNEDRVALGMDLPTSLQVKEFFIGLLLPFYSLFRAMDGLGYSSKKNILLTFTYFSMYVMWIVFFALTGTNIGYAAFGWSCFFINACILTYVRAQVRKRFSLDGNVVADFFAGSFLYPQAFCQIMVEFATNDKAPKEEVITDKVLTKSDEVARSETDEKVVMETDEAVLVEDTLDKDFTA